MSNAEIGQVLGRSEGAIKSLYHRTLVSLKELLAEHENLVKEFSDPAAAAGVELEERVVDGSPATCRRPG